MDNQVVIRRVPPVALATTASAVAAGLSVVHVLCTWFTYHGVFRDIALVGSHADLFMRAVGIAAIFLASTWITVFFAALIFNALASRRIINLTIKTEATEQPNP